MLASAAKIDAVWNTSELLSGLCTGWMNTCIWLDIGLESPFKGRAWLKSRLVKGEGSDGWKDW